MRYSGFESFSGHILFTCCMMFVLFCPPLPSPLSDLFSLLPLIIYLINNHLVSLCTHHCIPQIRLSVHLILQVPLRDPQLSPFTTFTFILLCLIYPIHYHLSTQERVVWHSGDWPLAAHLNHTF